VRYGSIGAGGLEYEVPQSWLYCLCINMALCSTALQCICRVIRRSSMTMKAHIYYILFGRPPIGGSFPLPLAAPLVPAHTRVVGLCPGTTESTTVLTATTTAPATTTVSHMTTLAGRLKFNGAFTNNLGLVHLTFSISLLYHTDLVLNNRPIVHRVSKTPPL